MTEISCILFYVSLNEGNFVEQECIPVGCVPSAAVAVSPAGGCTWSGGVYLVGGAGVYLVQGEGDVPGLGGCTWSQGGVPGPRGCT